MAGEEGRKVVSIGFDPEDQGVVEIGWAVGQREKDTGPEAARREADILDWVVGSWKTRPDCQNFEEGIGWGNLLGLDTCGE